MAVLISSVVLLISVATCSIIPAFTYRNTVPLPEEKVHRATANWLNAPTGVFVGVSISGGGSRAAVFGAAVLRELDDLGFLNHLTAISSVSGDRCQPHTMLLTGAYTPGIRKRCSN
jgi:hypothetical protein